VASTALNALHTFLTVARRRSFAAAASELGISASALSQAVRQLEERLGVTLLARTTRSVALTAAGRQLLEQAGPGVNQALAALKTAAVQPGEVTGTLRLNVPSISLRLVTGRLVAAFAERHPRVEIDVVVENRMVDIVAEGFDAGIRLEEFLERDMVAVRLSRELRWVVVGAPSYLARRGTPERPRDLLAHDCIGYRSSNTGAIYPWELERGKKDWRVPVRGTLVTNDERFPLAMAEAGMGLAYVMELDAVEQLERGTLRLVLEDYAATAPGFFLYFPGRAQVSPALRAFLDVARALGEASLPAAPGRGARPAPARR
jgi:DNA-binding transcriptional LysR family regulator